MENIIGIYKPKGPTSHDIVDKIRTITGIKKVGHAGTLDPLAQGILVIGIGRDATKKLGAIVQKEKEYIAEIFLGEKSSTDDSEGKKIKYEIKKIPTLEEIKDMVKKYIGKIEQIPPQFSAIKVRGTAAYARARKGENIELAPREVEIKNIEIISYSFPYLVIRATTGPGVYIRALARDIGDTLSCGAYLGSLERTRVGEFTKENSYTLEAFAKMQNLKNK